MDGWMDGQTDGRKESNIDTVPYLLMLRSSVPSVALVKIENLCCVLPSTCLSLLVWAWGMKEC